MNAMPLLVTRLHGHRVACSYVRLGFGPHVWIGELRRDDDSAVTTHLNGGTDTHRVQELRVAPELGDLLRVLDKAAATLQPAGPRARPAGRAGHAQGTSIGNPDPYAR